MVKVVTGRFDHGWWRIYANKLTTRFRQEVVHSSERADMLETQVGQSRKEDPVDVARVGFDAMMRTDGDGISGWKNTLPSAIANVAPAGALAEQHRRMAEPGAAERAGSQAARMRVP